ncbi:kinase-like domain-containing protein [Leptodontidium sp. MPI-SDFR-AT-0119]|nr:kinase-like domain-containing protein [Leptodontidium sp. MPI-SDFR-AT-0119]
MSDEINYPTGFSLKDIVAWGNSGMVCLDEASQTVVKSPHGQENEDDIAIEKRIYERFSEHGGHEGLLYYHGPYELGIRLDFACNGNLRSFLKKPGKDIDIELRLRWAKQIGDALRFVQATNVVHGDVTCGNILLDGQFNTKLSDFGGSSLDGSPLLVAVTASHRCPGPAVSIQGDIFALGSTLYEIMTGDVPYHELPEEEVEARYSKGEFPETNFLGPIGDVITLCWHGQYSSFDTIITDIEGMCAPNGY